MPTIFDLLNQFDFLRGLPAVYLVLLTAVILVVAWDWRLALLALAGQYLLAGLLFADVLDPRLMVVKVLNGFFICLILYITARQVNWGRLPEDLTPAEVARVEQEPRVALGPLQIPVQAPLRLFLVMLLVLLIFTVGQQPSFQLPGIAEAQSHINLAIFILVGSGLLGMAITTSPLPAGMAALMFLTGFELFYSLLEQSVGMLALLVIVNLATALAAAYLTQRYRAWPVLLE
ncbi:MAG: hypothetical protein R6X32_05865 [Chloroflexota bacterium]|jgi:hypothetical protein